MSKEETKAPEAQDEVAPKNAFKKLKKPALTLAFIAINIAVIAITAFSEFGNSENAAALSDVQMQWWFLLPAIACFVIAMICEINKYVLMMREMTSDKSKFDRKRARKVAPA